MVGLTAFSTVVHPRPRPTHPHPPRAKTMEHLPTHHTAPERLTQLNDRAVNQDGKFLLYWMQHGQRAHENPALEYAIRWANELDTPCVVAFSLMDDYPDGSLRHFQFMLEGLKEVADRLAER